MYSSYYFTILSILLTEINDENSVYIQFAKKLSVINTIYIDVTDITII